MLIEGYLMISTSNLTVFRTEKWLHVTFSCEFVREKIIQDEKITQFRTKKIIQDILKFFFHAKLK